MRESARGGSLKTITIKYFNARGEEGMQIPDGPGGGFFTKDGATILVTQGEAGLLIEIKAAPPMYVEVEPELDDPEL